MTDDIFFAGITEGFDQSRAVSSIESLADQVRSIVMQNDSNSLSSGGSGTWSVTGVQYFVSYGEGIPQGLPGTFGGEAKLNITLSNGASGVLTITCLLGSPRLCRPCPRTCSLHRRPS